MVWEVWLGSVLIIRDSLPVSPVFAGGTDLPEMLKICGQHRPRQDAALQHFREPNRMATVRWGVARKSMEPARDYFLMKGRREMPMVENLYKELLGARKKMQRRRNY